jgi:hypothetical protein
MCASFKVPGSGVIYPSPGTVVKLFLVCFFIVHFILSRTSPRSSRPSHPSPPGYTSRC